MPNTAENPQKAERPKLSDGKVDRLIWQPSDGNGDSTPVLIEQTLNKKKGHPTWKLFTGGSGPQQLSGTYPPRFVYLDDKAAWDIWSSKTWTRHDRHRFWPYDFTAHGKISIKRPNRGRAAYEQDGRTYASVSKRNGEKHLLSGGLSPPEAGASNASTSAPADTVVVAQRSNSTPAGLQPTQLAGTTDSAQLGSIATEQSPQAAELRVVSCSPTPTPSRAEALTAETPSHPSGRNDIPSSVIPIVGDSHPVETPIHEPQPAKSTRSPSKSPMPVQNANTHPHSERTLPEVPQLTLLTHPILPRPGSTALRTPQPTDSTASPPPTPSSRALKRSASPTSDHPPAALKRQRKALTPYDIPVATRIQDAELLNLRQTMREAIGREAQKDAEIQRLQQEVASQQTQLLNRERLCETSARTSATFRALAQQLYAQAVDQQSALAERHTAAVALLQDATDMRSVAERVAMGARTELGPIQALHGRIDAVLNWAESRMREQGLGIEFDRFVNEAMELDSDE